MVDTGKVVVLAACLLAAASGKGWTMSNAGIPAAFPSDAVMAGVAEIQDMQAWAGSAFADAAPKSRRQKVALKVLRQDFNTLRFGQSCMETPVTIGSRRFKHGLGTHAVSEIAVQVPVGATAFRASVGVDNNYDTQGVRGSVQFVVETDGREALRTATLRGGGEPVDVNVPIPSGVAQIVLKVDPTPDGPSCDQADWADARFELPGGKTLWLDQNQPDHLLLPAMPPFSFVYGGRPSAEILGGWKHSCSTKVCAGFVQYVARWEDPETGLAVQASARVFDRFPAAEWVVEFENQGHKDTPIIQDIQALDVMLGTGLSTRLGVVHQLKGDACGEDSFLPFDSALNAGQTVRMAPARGRSSQETAFPFFNVQYADHGLITAVGWTGQWAASLERQQTGPTRLRAGMEQTHLLLHPGERIRTPRILVMPWKGDRQTAHNRFRRLMLAHFVPQEDGHPARLPFVLQTFDRYRMRPGWITEAGQIKAAEMAHALGCDTYWLDAAWFPGDFPNGVGNWFCKSAELPNGLKPVSDACHRMGMRFVLWFEPERVAAGTQIAREHPEFVFGGEAGGLFKLNDPAARRYLTDLLSRRIEEYGIDIYRNDFNIDPLAFWRGNDTPDRQGMTEIQYVTGLYQMWDDLRTRHPGLMIDNCASGGRRIDLEMCMRSMPFWRSDTSCWAGHPEWNQTQTCRLCPYIPLQTACGWDPDAYTFRSSATGGAIAQFGYMEDSFSAKLARQSIAEAKANSKYWYGDFYQLTSAGNDLQEFVAYQFHRADLNAGVIYAFRRPECDTMGLILAPRALDATKTYRVECVDDNRRTAVRTVSGQEIMQSGLALRLPKKGSSLLVRYSEVKQPSR